MFKMSSEIELKFVPIIDASIVVKKKSVIGEVSLAEGLYFIAQIFTVVFDVIDHP